MCVYIIFLKSHSHFFFFFYFVVVVVSLLDGTVLPPPPEVDVTQLPLSYRESLAKLAIYQQVLLDGLEDVLETAELHSRYGTLAVKSGTNTQISWLYAVDAVQDSLSAQRASSKNSATKSSKSSSPFKSHTQSLSEDNTSSSTWGTPTSFDKSSNNSSYNRDNNVRSNTNNNRSNINYNDSNPWAAENKNRNSQQATTTTKTPPSSSPFTTPTRHNSAPVYAFEMSDERRRQEVEARWGK